MSNLVDRLNKAIRSLDWEDQRQVVIEAVDTIESMRQQLTEKDAEIARRITLDEMTVEVESATKAVADFYEKQLAAIQLREQQLREALGHYRGRYGNSGNMELRADEALALPADTTALSAIVTKAGEVMRQRAILPFIQDHCEYFGREITDAIRALPAITIEDLKIE